MLEIKQLWIEDCDMFDENYLQRELYDLVKTDTGIFEFIQSGSLDGIWYWDLDAPEHEWMSPKFWETLGYKADEKKHLASEWQDIINKIGRASCRERV